MQDSGGGGGSTGTPWYTMSIEDMWHFVSRDLSPHYTQANGWKKASELYGLYQSRLQAFRDKLAVAWNPKNSKAAEAYLTKLDELIKAVKDVDEVAGRNYQAAVDIPNAISEAKFKLQPIYDAYKRAATDFTKAGGSSTGGSYANTTSSSSQEQKDAAEAVNMKHYAAQSVMYKLSEDLSRARPQLGQPAPYVAPTSKHDDGGDYNASATPMAVIPPVVPYVPPASTPPPGPTAPYPTPRGPDLSSLTPPQTQPTMPTGPTSPFTPTPTGPPGSTHIPPGHVIGQPNGPVPAGGVKPSTGRPTGPIPGGGVRPPGGMSGGIIGGAPPAGGRGVPGGARANPPGGMIGGASAGRGGAGAAGRGVAGGVVGGRGPGAAGGRGPGGAGGRGGPGVAGGRGAIGAMGVGGRAGQGNDEDGDHFDPDTQWDVAQGVAPVLDAPEAQGPIDPGPAIGLGR